MGPRPAGLVSRFTIASIEMLEVAVAFSGFTDSDYDVFEIPVFVDRMAAIRSQVRPKLLEIGEEMVPRLRPALGPDLHAHAASHMRRRVNPPPDTWVAFGPSRRGYKAYPHLSIGIGAEGPYVEFIVMEESEHKAILSEGLIRNAEALAPCLRRLEGARLHLDHHAPTAGIDAAEVTPAILAEMAREVVRLKGNEFMIDRPFDRAEGRIAGRCLLDTAHDLLVQLVPFYRCALEPDYRYGKEG